MAGRCRRAKSSMRWIAYPGAPAEGGIDVDLVRARLEYLEQVVQPVHRHPRAMRAALAGRTLAGGGGLDEVDAGQALPHLVDDAAVGRDDVLPGAEAFRGLDHAGGGAHRVGHRDHARRRLRVHEHQGVRVRELHLFQLLRLELLVHDAGGVPQQHVRARHVADVVAEMLVGCEEDLLSLRVQVGDDLLGDRRGDHPVGARLHRRAGVGVHHDHAVRMRIAEAREVVGGAGEVQRAFRREVGHEDALLGIQDLGRLAHEAHARHHDRLAGVFVAEAGHLQRVRYRAAGGLREILQVRMHVVVRDEHGIQGLQALLDARDERGLLRVRREVRRLRGMNPERAVEAFETNLDRVGHCHGSVPL